MKKIIIFIPYLICGGAQRVVINLLKGFDKLEFDLTLIVVDKEGLFSFQISEEVQFIELEKDRVLTSVFELAKIFKEQNPDIIFSHLNYANIIAVMAAKLARVKSKIIVTEHSNYLAGKKKNKIRKKFFDFLLKMTYKLTDKIVTVSDGVAKSLKLAGFEGEKYDFKTIYNPIVTTELFEKKNNEVKHSWINNPDIKVIIAVGNLREAKDYPTLIKSFSIAKKKVNNLKLIVLGEGKKRKELEKLISELELNDDIELIGFVDNPFAYMSKADLFVLSSQWEGFGNVIVEAMACGCPVISTDCPYGPNEIIDNGENGILTSVGNEKEIAEKIILLLTNEDLRINIRMNGLKRAKDFKVRKITNKYKNLFDEII
ncbi:glycosyltransferase [Natroniella sulfidigena]|uniref:glycosyltransferase n=1 Tax=Natroniella sulfidigena TaxID=723921 RepID=UPI00200B7291|nr:glycosyltransferase [Natroniella sulfidigena]MCK8816305.1 glycosyltransferase [Natroniella sulfidigena]